MELSPESRQVVLRQQLQLSARSRFLDIGCGRGMVLIDALNLGVKMVVGVDKNPDMLNEVRRTLKASRWAVVKERHYSLEDQTPDVVYYVVRGDDPNTLSSVRIVIADLIHITDFPKPIDTTTDNEVNWNADSRMYWYGMLMHDDVKRGVCKALQKVIVRGRVVYVYQPGNDDPLDRKRDPLFEYGLKRKEWKLCRRTWATRADFLDTTGTPPEDASSFLYVRGSLTGKIATTPNLENEAESQAVARFNARVERYAREAADEGAALRAVAPYMRALNEHLKGAVSNADADEEDLPDAADDHESEELSICSDSDELSICSDSEELSDYDGDPEWIRQLYSFRDDSVVPDGPLLSSDQRNQASESRVQNLNVDRKAAWDGGTYRRRLGQRRTVMRLARQQSHLEVPYVIASPQGLKTPDFSKNGGPFVHCVWCEVPVTNAKTGVLIGATVADGIWCGQCDRTARRVRHDISPEAYPTLDNNNISLQVRRNGTHVWEYCTVVRRAWCDRVDIVITRTPGGWTGTQDIVATPRALRSLLHAPQR